MTWLLNWRVWAAAGVVSLALWGYIQTVRLGACQDSLKAERERVAVLGAQIEEQNRAVEGWQAKMASAQATAAQERRKAEERSKGAKAEIRRLEAALNAPRSADAPARTCNDALRELRGVR